MKNLFVGSLFLLACAAQPGLASEATTLPPTISGQMQDGKYLYRLWVSPKFNAAQGLQLGKVDATVQNAFIGDILKYVPLSFTRFGVSRSESTNVLNLTLTEMYIKERQPRFYTAVTLGIEGQVLDKDGTPLLAFVARPEDNGANSVSDDSRGAVDMMVKALAKELGLPLQKHVKVVKVVKGPKAPAPVPPAAPVIAPAPAVAAGQPAPAVATSQPAQAPAAKAPATTDQHANPFAPDEEDDENIDALLPADGAHHWHH